MDETGAARLAWLLPEADTADRATAGPSGLAADGGAAATARDAVLIDLWSNTPVIPGGHAPRSG